jgi:beta-glucosidase
MCIESTVSPQTELHLATTFPPDFLWGAATASYQIEGATREGGRGPSIWDTFAATPGKVFQGDSGDIADDHYHHMPEDVDLIAQLGLQAYRFSIAWPRILPQGRGQVNNVGLDFYDRLVDNLLVRGIQPFATLYHWDLPQTLQDEGGWIDRATAYAFADYAEIVVKRLGDRVAGWTTLNEPWCSAFLGYGAGIHAPGLKDMQSAFDAGHHLLLAHGLAVPRIRASSKAQVGITLNFTPGYAADDRAETQQALDRYDAFSTRWFLEPLTRGSYPEHLFAYANVKHPPIADQDLQLISTPIDFLGVNNYSRSVIRGRQATTPIEAIEQVAPVPEACYTDMGWEIYPDGLFNLLMRLHHEYHIPKMYITENGAAFKDHWNSNGQIEDTRRIAYLNAYIRAVGTAIQQGAPVHGYFVWSLLDNFEWTEGYSKRFGIVYVDYPTQRRIIKNSGRWYADLISRYKETHA